MTDWTREMGKALKVMAGHRSNHEAWADFAIASAATLGAPLGLDKPLRDDAERIRAKYDATELEAMAKMLACTIGALEDNPRQDFLGSAYMALEIGNKKDGQFFTPYAVCEAMANDTITADGCERAISDHGYVALNDPACGGCATLIAGANRLRELGIDQHHAWFEAQDLNTETACMGYVQLALLGCAGVVVIGDTLAYEARHVLHLPMNVISPWWTARALKGEMPCTPSYAKRAASVAAD